MARPSPSFLRSVAALSQKACGRHAVRQTPNLSSNAGASAPELASSFRHPSSRISRLRGGMVCLESLQPLQAARSQASFVSRLSLGFQEPVSLLQGHFFSALTEL